MKNKQRITTLLLIAFVAFAVLGFQGKKTVPLADEFEPVVVVELFTSQGCSSCPPADKLLANTIAGSGKSGAKIFALSYHVDYWNRLGWADPFSDKKYSQRQAAYVSKFNLEGAYTPQVVVNGTAEFVGSDATALERSVGAALRTKPSVGFRKLKAVLAGGKSIHVAYQLEGNFAGSRIMFALVSLKETTVVKRGENGGRTLQNENVVRQLLALDPAPTGSVDFEKTGAMDISNLAVVAFVQEQAHFRIIGAGMTKIE